MVVLTVKGLIAHSYIDIYFVSQDALKNVIQYVCCLKSTNIDCIQMSQKCLIVEDIHYHYRLHVLFN